MLRIPPVPQPAVNAWNNLVKATGYVPGLNASVSFLFKNIIANPVSFLFKNLLATPVQGFASLAGKATRPASSDMKASALTIVGLLFANYVRKTTYGQTATNFVSKNVGHYSGVTARSATANHDIAQAIANVGTKKAEIAQLKNANESLFTEIENNTKAIVEARAKQADTTDLTTKAEELAKEEPAKTLITLTIELDQLVTAAAAKKSVWASRANNAKVDALVKEQATKV